MKTYYHTTTHELRDFEESWFDAMTEVNNPKVQRWVLRPNPPSHDSETQHTPEWIDGTWFVRDKTEAELDAEYVIAYPHAENYQVRAWLIRNGIDPASIPALITSLTPFGPERQEALMRWEHAVKIPANHPLVTAIASTSSLNLNLETVWPSILEL